MSGNDIISKVSRALHIADSIHTEDAALAQELLHAVEQCREAQKRFLDLLDQLHPTTVAAEQARAELQKQMREMDCGEHLLGTILDTGEPTTSQILTELPPEQLH